MISLARFWFTSLWQPKKLLKAIEKPNYLMALLNLLIPPLLVSIVGIFVLSGGIGSVDVSAYAKTIVVSVVKYAAVLLMFGIGAVSAGKGSLKRMVCFASFPVTGYLLLVDSALIIGNPVAGIPISIVLKSLLIAFAISMAGIAHAEAKMKWWKAGVWIAVVIAVTDYFTPYLASLI
ncbi:hypothetical protein ACFLQ2_05150 [archaeon]